MANIIQESPKTLQRVSEACHEDDCCLSICSYRIPIKRFFLPLVGSMGFVILPIFQTYMYLPWLVFLTFFVIFWNFPCIITFMNSKPLYYEDLFIAGSTEPVQTINPNVRRKFECAFEWSLIFTNSLFTAALSEYWLYQTGSAQSYVEILGVTGGILKIFQAINHINGGMILHITRSLIDREINNASSIKQPGVVIELVELGDENPPIETPENINMVVHIGTSPSTSSGVGPASRDALPSDQDSTSVPTH